MVRFAPAAVEGWDFPRAAAGVRLLVEHAVAHGLAPGEVLAGSGLPVGDELPAEAEVTAAQELRVVRNLRACLGEVGASVGRRYRAATFGALGYALVSSPTLLEAMNVALRFLDLSHTFTLPRAEVDGDRVQVVVDAGALPADVRRFLLERDTAAIRAVLAELGTPTPPPRRRADTARLTLPIAELGRRLAGSDPAALAMSEEVCRAVVEPRREGSGLVREARVLIAQRLWAGAPMAEVAGALGLTERTLRRRLTAGGTSYQRLLDEVRAALAADLLASGRLGVAEVAVRLGYAEATSFIAAHRRWTGRTPGAAGRTSTATGPTAARVPAAPRVPPVG